MYFSHCKEFAFILKWNSGNTIVKKIITEIFRFYRHRKAQVSLWNIAHYGIFSPSPVRKI